MKNNANYENLPYIEEIYRSEYDIKYGTFNSTNRANLKGKITLFYNKNDCRILFYKLNILSATITPEQTKSHLRGEVDKYGNIVKKDAPIARLKRELFNEINEKLNKNIQIVPSDSKRKRIYHQFDMDELLIFNDFLNNKFTQKTTFNGLINLLQGSNPSGALKSKRSNYTFSSNGIKVEDITILISMCNKGRSSFKKNPLIFNNYSTDFVKKNYNLNF